MDRTERFYRINQLLSCQRGVTLEQFLSDLEVSRATFKRDLEYLRDRLSAPIIWDREMRAYRYEQSQDEAGRYQLPGLWFNASELYALMVMEQLLENIQPGLLGPHVQPLQGQIRSILSQRYDVAELTERIRVLPQAKRSVDTEHFEVIAAAVMSRQCLQIEHYHRARDEQTGRLISPQRLVYYRDNWYLDAWCHLRQGLRTFSLDSIRQAELLKKKAKQVSKKELDRVLKGGYGIFSGEAMHKALLRFTPQRARWVASEIWHPEQQSRYDAAGYYLLTVPYSDPRELVMDILKYGADVEVVRPSGLRRQVAAQLQTALQVYSD